MAEEWRAIPGWEGYYEASDQGKVRSLDRTIQTRTSSRFLRGKVLRPRRHKNGYLFVVLCRDCVPATCTIHGLVLSAFVGERPAGLETRHLDGDQLNNNISNLCYGTAQENGYDRVRHGTTGTATPVVGVDHYEAKLDDDKVRYIRGNPQLSNVLLADMFGVSPSAISMSRLRKTWKHVA